MCKNLRGAPCFEASPGVVLGDDVDLRPGALPERSPLLLHYQHGANGLLVSPDSPYVDAAAKALTDTFGCPPLYTREGGSIPIITLMSDVLDADVLLLGWGQDDDNAHAPNEKFSLAAFHQGIKAGARLLREIARMS